MAQRQKRKLDSYEQGDIISSAAMPQTNTTGPSGNTTDYYDDRYPPVVPTPELQELYNTWRQQQELEAHLKAQAQVALGSSDGGSQHLRPHSAVSMSRSPSCASTSHSVTGGIKNMGLSDDKPAKKKQGRQGALNALKKAKAALVRKLSACPSCRSRKVGVSWTAKSALLFVEVMICSHKRTFLVPPPQLSSPRRCLSTIQTNRATGGPEA